jgi:lipase
MLLETHSWGPEDGRPVVCVHGVTAHGARFRQLAQEFLSDFRTVGLDLRGHGRSGWDPPWSVERHVADLVETPDALGIEGAYWIGHSFGGRLVAELARRHPDRVERAVLLDPAMHIDPAVAGERAELMRADVSFADLDEAIEARLADGTLFSTPRAVLEEEAAAHLERGADGRFRARCSPPAVIVAWSEMSSPAPPWPQCPTLVVLGARSWIPVDVPTAPNIRTVTVPGGHTVLWDDLEATGDAVAGFLEGR